MSSLRDRLARANPEPPENGGSSDQNGVANGNGATNGNGTSAVTAHVDAALAAALPGHNGSHAAADAAPEHGGDGVTIAFLD